MRHLAGGTVLAATAASAARAMLRAAAGHVQAAAVHAPGGAGGSRPGDRAAGAVRTRQGDEVLRAGPLRDADHGRDGHPRAGRRRRQGCAPHGGERPMTHTTTLASAGTSYTAIGVLLAIFVPICAAVAVIVWNYYRLQRHRADAVAMASYRKLAEEAVANMTELRAEMTKLAENVSAVEQLMRDVG